MKAYRIMVFAAAAMLFAACGKDEVTDSAVTPKPHTDYLICDGVAHPFVKETALGENGFYQVYLSPATPGDDFRVELLMKQEDVGKNFDLTTDHAGDYSIDVRLDEAATFSFEAYEGVVYSVYGDSIYEDVSVLSEGRFFTQLTDVDFSTEVDVLLANGHRIRIGTVTPVDSIRYLPYCGSNVD